MVGEHKRLEATLRISVHPSFVLNRQRSCSMTRKPMIVSYFLEWSLSGEWSVVAVRTTAPALLTPSYLGQRKYFVMKGAVPLSLSHVSDVGSIFARHQLCFFAITAAS